MDDMILPVCLQLQLDVKAQKVLVTLTRGMTVNSKMDEQNDWSEMKNQSQVPTNVWKHEFVVDPVLLIYPCYLLLL